MRRAWRLGISSLFARPSRAILLVLVVAMASMLIAAVGVALGSVRAAIEQRVLAVVGSSDVRLRAAGVGKTMPQSLADTAAAWPGVRLAAPRLTASLGLRFVRPIWTARPDGTWTRAPLDLRVTAPIYGIVAEAENAVRPIRIASGRLPNTPDEIVLDQSLAERLSERQTTFQLGSAGLSILARTSSLSIMKSDQGPESVATDAEATRLNSAGGVALGDPIEVVRIGEDPIRLTVVGLAPPPPLGGTPTAIMTLEGLQQVSSQPGRVSQVDMMLDAGHDPLAFVATHGSELPKSARLLPTEKITSGLQANLQANQIGFLVASIMSFFGAAFIITTGLAVGVVERLRELAVLRCIGATRVQLVVSQLVQGLALGLLGGAVGVPIGTALAWFMLDYYKDALAAEPIIDPARILWALAGSVVCGLLGSIWPAIQVSRVSPLAALSVRAKLPSPWLMRALLIAGLCGVAFHLALFTLVSNGQFIFWTYVTIGLPIYMVGYFCLGPPTTLAAARLLSKPISALLRIPRGLLRRSIEATPYRFGFTSGAMMAGLALLVAIWTQGGAALRDWIEKLRVPDAFVVGLAMDQRTIDELRKLDFVLDTSPVSLHPVETEAFGIKGLTSIKTFFVAFEPESFFRMTALEWFQGDPAVAQARLAQGGAVIVSREFLTASNIGVGGTWTCKDDDGESHSFEIVGVVGSPGLEIVSNFFDVGEDFTEARVHSVFGSQKDLKDIFGIDTIGMIQIDLADSIDDEEALEIIREKLLPAGILSAGSGRAIKRDIMSFAGTALVVSSSVAIFAMAVACLGVANLIIAGVQARRFEFGVLRAVGASRSLLTRLVLAEALVVALTACVLGSLMGVQGAFGGTRLNTLIWGLDLALKPPPIPILIGCIAVIIMTLAAAGPAAFSLSRQRVRELLGAMRG